MPNVSSVITSPQSGGWVCTVGNARIVVQVLTQCTSVFIALHGLNIEKSILYICTRMYMGIIQRSSYLELWSFFSSNAHSSCVEICFYTFTLVYISTWPFCISFSDAIPHKIFRVYPSPKWRNPLVWVKVTLYSLILCIITQGMHWPEIICFSRYLNFSDISVLFER